MNQQETVVGNNQQKGSCFRKTTNILEGQKAQLHWNSAPIFGPGKNGFHPIEVHSNRVLHRDLKPSNVMLTRPVVKRNDWLEDRCCNGPK